MNRKHSRTVRKKNFGFGRSLLYATKRLLISMYGAEAHYNTRFTHTARFAHFVTWLRGHDGTQDARKITCKHIYAYAQALRGQVDAETMSVDYAQNLLSTVNTVTEGFRRDRTLWVSPAKHVGRRISVRKTLPDGCNWDQVWAAVEQAINSGNSRGGAIIALCRAFGMRRREACLADLERLHREFQRNGEVAVLEGCKGGRKSRDRTIFASEHQRRALALARFVRPKNCRCLIAPDETLRLFIQRVVQPARKSLRAAGIRCPHDLRAAFAIDEYERITGQPVPLKQRPIDKELDAIGRQHVSRVLGHNRSAIASAYIGAAR